MSGNVFAKLLRKSTMSMHHQAVRTQSRKSLETLDQTLNQSNDDPLIDSSISPKLSLASLQLNDPVVSKSSVVVPTSARSPVNTLKPHLLMNGTTRTARVVKERNSILDDQFQTLRQVLTLPDDTSESDVLTIATDLILSLQGVNQKLTTQADQMTQLLGLSMKELGEVRAENKTLQTPPSRPRSALENESPRPPSARPPRHPSLKRHLYHESFTYTSASDENNQSIDQSTNPVVKLEPMDSLSRASSASSESSLFTLSQAASLVADKPDLSSFQHNQLMNLMRLQSHYRENMTSTSTEGTNRAEPISKRQKIDLVMLSPSIKLKTQTPHKAL